MNKELLLLNLWNSIKKVLCYYTGLRKITTLFIKPWKKYDKLADIDIKSLKKEGVKLLIIDMDGTLKYRKTGITKENIKWVKSIKKDFDIYIITNASNYLASKEANKIDVPYYYKARKPSKKGFNYIVNKMKVSKDEVCVIGDALVADIYGSHRSGIKKTILVKDLNVYYGKI
jgi:hypothetical protein